MTLELGVSLFIISMVFLNRDKLPTLSFGLKDASHMALEEQAEYTGLTIEEIKSGEKQ